MTGIKDILKQSYLFRFAKVMRAPYLRAADNGVSCTPATKYWIENSIVLKFVRYYKDYAVLMHNDDVSYIVHSNKLYAVKSGLRSFICDYRFNDYLYYDMCSLDGYYAIRSGGVIRVSRNLKDWEEIYNGYRGIKKSMLLIDREGEHYLMFIEYSTGHQKHNHRILEYSFKSGKIRTVKEFRNRTTSDYDASEDFARHIHLIDRDPFSGDIYVGTGDFEYEPGIFVSHDFGVTFEKMGGGTPMYRVLSFYFTESFIFWSTDTPEPQYIYRYDRNTRAIDGFPLINSALWCSVSCRFNEEEFHIISSNSEGSICDTFNRVYGMVIRDNTPVIYELKKRRSRFVYSQLFVQCACGSSIFFYDVDLNLTVEYRLSLHK